MSMGNLDMGSTAIVSTATDPLNLRNAPEMGNNIVMELPRHSTVTIDGSPQNGFYPVTTPDGTQGFAAAAYLSAAPAAVTPYVDLDQPPPFVPGVVDEPTPAPLPAPPPNPDFAPPADAAPEGMSMGKKIAIGAGVLAAVAVVVVAASGTTKVSLQASRARR